MMDCIRPEVVSQTTPSFLKLILVTYVITEQGK